MTDTQILRDNGMMYDRHTKGCMKTFATDALLTVLCESEQSNIKVRLLHTQLWNNQNEMRITTKVVMIS